MAKERSIRLGGQTPPGGSFQHVPTAAEQQAQQQVPQPIPIQQQPGGANSLPLPVGQPVALDADKLTPKERADLESFGWKPGMPIPDNMAEWIEKVKAEATDPNLMPPPIDPSTPPLQPPKAIDIQDLPESKRKELEEVLRQTGVKAQAIEQQNNQMPTQPGEGVADAIRAADGGARKLNLDTDIPDLSRPKQTQAPQQPVEQQTPQQPQAPQPEQQEPNPAPPETASGQHICPNCAWDMGIADVAEVTESDKQSFLASTLGGIPLLKTYDLLAGKLQITIRSLSPDEVDVCYKQCYTDRTNNLIATAADFFEQLNRYRLCLQLVEIRSPEDLVKFPESLEAWTKNAGPVDRTTIMKQIFAAVYGGALNSETMVRLSTKCMNQFNRIVSRMEVNCDNENFWKAVEPAS